MVSMQQTTAPEDNLVVIDVSDSANKWRYTCPRGHRAFEATNGGIWCRPCEHDEGDGHHREIQDKREKELISMDRVRLVDGRE